MAKNRLVRSPLTNNIYIYNGRDKIDVTQLACGLVAEHIESFGDPLIISINGKPIYEVVVKRLGAGKLATTVEPKPVVYNKAVCLACGEVLVSKHVHDMVYCKCPNHSAIDGGKEYHKVSGKNLDLIKSVVSLSEAKRVAEQVITRIAKNG